MELIDAVLFGQRVRVASSVSVGVISCESRGGVEGLVYITYVVDKESQVERVS